MRLSELAAIGGGSLRGRDCDFRGAGIDSRTLRPDQLFVALAGTRCDGHDFVAQAERQGAAAALVERWVDCALPQVRVADVRRALGQVAAEWRSRLPVRLVGVTGSNGKTTAKEMIAAVLGEAGTTLKTRGNLNNDLGVPLTLLELEAAQRYGVIEMGANHPGEIAYVAGLARPEVGVITNAGAAHLEGFGSREGVARAKGELIQALSADGVAVLNADDPFLGLWRDLAGSRRAIRFGFGADAEVAGIADSIRMSCDADGFRSSFEFVHSSRRHRAEIGLAGRHNVANALAAIAVGIALGLELDQTAAGLAKVRPVAGRMQPTRAEAGALVINDSYNANPTSFRAALEVLLELPGEPWVALGALGELGETSAGLHAELGRQAKAMGVRRLFATGPDAEHSVESFGDGATYFADQAELIGQLQRELRENVVVLVKGSRSQRMERVVEALMQKREGFACY
ncbi:MAG: UDP-N-acetylmuramoyl-tripeptide--D-alanyl-D-alanine ligase [Methylococcaceae bacterium]|nr:UDP-N-acetylmuramoyl-tripeptide--D-alanyl-D-alanine ligase [Methylococcaceae bacterium]